MVFCSSADLLSDEALLSESVLLSLTVSLLLFSVFGLAAAQHAINFAVEDAGHGSRAALEGSRTGGRSFLKSKAQAEQKVNVRFHNSFVEAKNRWWRG